MTKRNKDPLAIRENIFYKYTVTWLDKSEVLELLEEELKNTLYDKRTIRNYLKSYDKKLKEDKSYKCAIYTGEDMEITSKCSFLFLPEEYKSDTFTLEFTHEDVEKIVMNKRKTLSEFLNFLRNTNGFKRYLEEKETQNVKILDLYKFFSLYEKETNELVKKNGHFTIEGIKELLKRNKEKEGKITKQDIKNLKREISNKRKEKR